jgi:hypothetical protein
MPLAARRQFNASVDPAQEIAEFQLASVHVKSDKQRRPIHHRPKNAKFRRDLT